jgi:integrase
MLVFKAFPITVDSGAGVACPKPTPVFRILHLSMASQLKPAKPNERYPLYAHAIGQWAKKWKGKVYYFGPWANPQAALKRYKAEWPRIQAGIPRKPEPTPCPTPGVPTVASVLEAFFADKQRAHEAGEINDRTLGEYNGICVTIGDALGDDTPVDLLTYDALSKLRSKLGKGKRGQKVSPVTHKRLLTFARMVFSFANDELGTDIRYKKALKTPPARVIRAVRNEVGERLFSAAEVSKLITADDPELRAMILLGINCAFGPKDCYTLPISAVDLLGGWHNYPRPKTQATRRCPLWLETIEALRVVIGERASGTVFHKYDNRQVWNRHIVGRAFKTLTEGLNIYRENVTTFYSLRRTFETIAATADVNQCVVDAIMGHAPRSGDMAAVYRQRVFDDQLRKCVEHVRCWMLGSILLN